MNIQGFGNTHSLNSLAETARSQGDNALEWMMRRLRGVHNFSERQAELSAPFILLTRTRPDFGKACAEFTNAITGSWTAYTKSGTSYTGNSESTTCIFSSSYLFRYTHEGKSWWPSAVTDGGNQWRKSLSGVFLPIVTGVEQVVLMMGDDDQIAKVSVEVGDRKITVDGRRLNYSPQP